MTPEENIKIALASLRKERKNIVAVTKFWYSIYPMDKTSMEVQQAVTVPVGYIPFVNFVVLMEECYKLFGTEADNAHLKAPEVPPVEKT